MRYAIFVLMLSFAMNSAARAADPNAGAKLVQTNGCMGCHGAHFEGGAGPKLLGIEHRLSPAQIATAISDPRAPMPKFPFSQVQVGDIVAYLSNLDGGTARTAPVVTFAPASPNDRAVVTVRFPGSPPRRVSAQPVMKMGGSSMSTARVSLTPTRDPHVWTGRVTFDMGGPWTIDVNYDGKHLTVPVNVTGT